ncbi:hypothetical protein SNE40_002820 [Patella caerulea]|uniref:Uncharacterized protein n=1 Tax=Patella caerulea TaxID=87958 RepID=A0AAN8Q7X3_PATCE
MPPKKTKEKKRKKGNSTGSEIDLSDMSHSEHNYPQQASFMFPDQPFIPTSNQHTPSIQPFLPSALYNVHNTLTEICRRLPGIETTVNRLQSIEQNIKEIYEKVNKTDKKITNMEERVRCVETTVAFVSDTYDEIMTEQKSLKQVISKDMADMKD